MIQPTRMNCSAPEMLKALLKAAHTGRRGSSGKVPASRIPAAAPMAR